MVKPPVPKDDALTDDDIIWVSKSELKRDAQALRDLGVELVKLGKNALAKIPLDEALLAEIQLAQQIKKEGQRRQLQLIGKMLRQRDITPIEQALDKLKNRHNQQVVAFHQLEQWREQLLDSPQTAIDQFLQQYPHADRQQLRTLIRNVQKEKTENRPPKAFRQLFQYLQQIIENRQ